MVNATLPDLLLNAATGDPERVALITPTESVTYGELCRRSLQLGAYLVEAGIEPGDRVLIYLPKCVELSTSIFGSLAVGACYVPVDCTTPAQRAKLIMRDAEPKVVICTAHLSHQLFDGIETNSPGTPRRISDRQICVYTLDRSPSTAGVRATTGAPWSQVTASPALSAPVSLDASARAYILYTSGSIGRPKGVVHTHESALTFVRWANDHLGLRSTDVVSQHASASFDLTVFDFFASAMAAATLLSIPDWMFGQVAKTYRFIAEQGVTVWYSVPSALLRDEGTKSLGILSESALRRVVFAGEVIPTKLLREFVRHLPPRCTVSNWYGPTETNVCTFYDVDAADLESNIPVPIGWPCSYAQIQATTSAEAGAGAGGEGELWVASPTVMVGYWNLDRVTAAALTRDPGGRMYYKTGDIVTYDDRGRLVFLGRQDRLLKVRGYRIQPEEIEQVLGEHPDVTEAAVVAVREDEVDRLIAIVGSMRTEETLSVELTRLCSERLPPYMVPSTIVRVDALPRGSRGKVDLQALSQSSLGRRAAGPGEDQ